MKQNNNNKEKNQNPSAMKGLFKRRYNHQVLNFHCQSVGINGLRAAAAASENPS